MGLMLSILVVCVGVIEALSCYEHFQYGILHCATNIYEHARRRSSVFLNYTSRRLKLLSDDSIAEDDHENSLRSELINEPVDDFINFEPGKTREGENKSKRGKKLAKFEKQDKIEIVKQLLEKPSRPPRAARSISMPERTSLIYTEKDLELTKIINELAIEPIDEINVEVEEVDDESVIEEFDKLFDESEGKFNSKPAESTVHNIKPVPTENLKVDDYKNEVVNEKNIKDIESGIKIVENEVKENEDSEEKNELKTNTKSISQKISKFDRPVKISRSTSIDLDKVSLLLSKSTSVDSDRPKKQTIPKNLPEINSTHKSPSDIKHPSSINVIFENEQPPELIDKTFEELFSDFNEEFSNEENVELNEIENIIIDALDDETVENLGKEFISNEIAKYIENNKAEIKNQKIKDRCRDIDVRDEFTTEKYSDLLNKFADRIVCECLSEIRNLEINNLKLEIFKTDNEKSESFQPKLKLKIQNEIQPQNISFNTSKSESNKSKEILNQPMTEISDFSKINLPEANDKPIILESCEKEQLQEPFNERKMTDENKNKNLTPIKLQFSLEEETTESSGRSSPTGSVVTILSVGSDDSSGSKPPEVSNETQAQNFKIPEKILAITNESVPAIEYKNPVSDVCKPVDIIPMKWTDQVDKELTTKKEVVELIKEAVQQEPLVVAESVQKSTNSASEKVEEKPTEDQILLIKKDIKEVESNKQETKPSDSLVSCNVTEENLNVEEKHKEAKPKSTEGTDSQIVQESKNENSQSILLTQPKTEANQENKPNDEKKAPNIPDDKKPPQADLLVKNVEAIPTKQEVTATEKPPQVDLSVKNVEETATKQEVIATEKPPQADLLVKNVEAIATKQEVAATEKPPQEDLLVKNVEAIATKQEVAATEKPPQEDLLVKNVEAIATKQEVTATEKTPNSEILVDQEKGMKENLETMPSLKADKLPDEQKVIVQEENSLPRPEVLAITAENILAIDYTPKVKPAAVEDNKNEIIPMEWKTEKEKLESEKEVDTNISSPNVDKVTEIKAIEVKESEPKSNTLFEDNKNEKLVVEPKNNNSVVEEPKKNEKVEKPVLAIKEEAALALEYKRKGNTNSEEGKQEVIPMEWKVDDDALKCEKTTEIIKNPNSKETKALETTVHTSETQNKSVLAESPSEKENKSDLGEKPKCSNKKEENDSTSDGISKKSKSLETKEGKQSTAPEAFWLIFSGEYTKAMSKDWHSGHFSCWQCDEALTGQRYVLRDDHPYCIKCYESVFANVCEECNKIIGIDSKDLSYKDKHWHEACFLCNKCRVSLVDKQFGSKADKIYCGNCYDAQFASRCDGCGEIFRAGTKKMEYKTRQWHEKCFCCCVCKTPIGTKSFIPREQEIYCATCYEEKFATRCVKCNKIITSGGVTYKNEPWHRECFTCTNCNTSLAGQRFTSRDEKPYCADCFGELFAKRCTSCSKPITGIGGTRFISFEDRHWHNDCFICASCKTSLVGRGFITDGDDIICPECAKQKLM